MQIPQDSRFDQRVQVDTVVLGRLMRLANDPALIDEDIDSADAVAIQQELIKECHADPVDRAEGEFHQDLLRSLIHRADIEQGRDQIIDILLFIIVIFLDGDLQITRVFSFLENRNHFSW